MKSPIETLSREHRVIEGALRTLDGICVKLQQGIEVPPETLLQLVDFIRTYADGFHHRKEEALLFPEIEKTGVVRRGGPIGMLLEEHETGRAFIEELSAAAEAYKNDGMKTVRRFVLAAWRYTELLTIHVHKEENLLFAIAYEVLDKATLESLQRAFDEEDKKLGAGLHEQYELIAAELEKAWAA